MVESKVVAEDLPVVDPVVVTSEVDITQDAPLFDDPLKEEEKDPLGLTIPEGKLKGEDTKVKKDSKSKGIKLGSRQGFGNDLGSQLNLVADIAKDLFHEGRLSIEVKDGKQTVYLLK
jgi:hypothetical protein